MREAVSEANMALQSRDKDGCVLHAVGICLQLYACMPPFSTGQRTGFSSPMPGHTALEGIRSAA